MKKRLLCALLAFCLTALLPVGAAAAPSTNYQLTGNQADDVIAVAKAQIGKTGKDLGYSADWCAYFVSWVGRSAGANYPSSDMANPRTLTHWFVNNGAGTFYYFRDKNYDSLISHHPDMKHRELCIKSDRSSFLPQEGDIILYLWSGAGSSINWSHTGIVEAYENGKVSTIEGNVGGKGYSANKVSACSRSFNSAEVVGVVRPNYLLTDNPAERIPEWTPYSPRYSVTDTNAVLSQTLSVPWTSINNVSSVGIYLYDSKGGFMASRTEKPIPLNGVINMWYDVNADLGKTLTPGTDYRYQFVAIVSGDPFYSKELTFTTTGNPPQHRHSGNYSNGYCEECLSWLPNRNGSAAVKTGFYLVQADDETANILADHPYRLAAEYGWVYNLLERGDMLEVTGAVVNGLGETWYIANYRGNSGYINSTAVQPYAHVHTLSHHAPKATTEQERGNIEYWFCAECGKYFSDEKAENEISETAALTPPPVFELHFPKRTVYYQDQFSDVPADKWYAKNVAAAFELGLMKGNADGSFNPEGNVTVAEAITMAARIHRIYSAGEESFAAPAGDQKWYQPYLDYAYRNGVISYAYYNSDVSHTATRAQFAEIFALALPDGALPQVNTVPDKKIPDVGMEAAYAAAVYKLYRAGILAGSDSKGTFHPDNTITRAEASAIVSRMADTDNRLSFTLG